MTKLEMIERHGLEWYKQLLERNNARRKEHYHSDPEYRESLKSRVKTYNTARWRNDHEFRKSRKVQTNAYNKARYVEGGRIDLIENYDIAMKDNLKGWDIHHRLELHPDCTLRFTRHSLIKLDLYYNRPPTELIWLRRSEHIGIHNKGKISAQ